MDIYSSFRQGMLSVLPLIVAFSSVYAVEWPKGNYTLVKPRVGCPYGWKEGWIQQDNEDLKNRNMITAGHNFSGKFGGDNIFYYCTKDRHVIGGTQNWPRGNYCILRSGIFCPPGFQTGSIYWDDEDYRNKNGRGGVLPSGSYGRDTLIRYCCRSDGSASTPIRLPTNKAFYLLRYTAPCQQVMGRVVREEIVKTDDEDYRNKNSVSGSHPLDDGGRDHRLFYCYYY